MGTKLSSTRLAVAKPELGTKRIDPETGQKFYDLNKDPIVSPYTGKTYPRSYFQEAKSDDLPDLGDDEDDVDLGDDEDDTFLADEEEEDDDVADMIGVGDDDD